MRLIIAFALAALLLASLGVYGVISFAVARRTPEIGVRLAMGARPGQLMFMMLQQGIRPVFAGLAIGVAASLAAGRLLAGELYEVRPNDPLALSAVVAVLLVAALAACPGARSAGDAR